MKEKVVIIGGKGTAVVIAEQIYDAQIRFGKEIEEIYGKVLKKYEAMGFLEESGGFWRFTRKGIHVSNHILSDFLQD